jgi:hypothetical protein
MTIFITGRSHNTQRNTLNILQSFFPPLPIQPNISALQYYHHHTVFKNSLIHEFYVIVSLTYTSNRLKGKFGQINLKKQLQLLILMQQN